MRGPIPAHSARGSRGSLVLNPRTEEEKYSPKGKTGQALLGVIAPLHIPSSPAVGPFPLSLQAQKRALRLGHKNRHFIFSSRSLSLLGTGLKAEGWEEEGAGGGSGGGRNEKGEGSGYCAACGGSIPTGGFPNIVFNFLKAARDPETASPGAEDPGAGRAGG